MQLSLNDKEVEDLTDFFVNTDMDKWAHTSRFLRKKMPHYKKFAAITATVHRNSIAYLQMIQLEEEIRIDCEIRQVLAKSIGAEKKDPSMYV